MAYLDEILSAHKRGESKGITSICSAHPTVIETAFSHACIHNTPLLIESTCNQVNQYGGYTGMTPLGFFRYIRKVADLYKYPQQNLILGGDHLGPEVWQSEPAEKAMDKARVLIRDYVHAGYLKIHLDASMRLGDDSDKQLQIAKAAERAAELARVAEDTFRRRGGGEAPRYVIGTEVPVPGGAREEETSLQPTRVSDAEETLQTTRQAFYNRGLESAWVRVIALVVQPGVEFGHDFIIDYDPVAAQSLSRFIENRDLVYEAHSTDYQTSAALHQMVRDHFAVLKVGPALTFAYREAVFALAMMEAILVPEPERSNLIEVVDQVMVANPNHWRKYYQGDLSQQRYARFYSYSDRCRYYWTHPTLQAAFKRLLKNLQDHPVPLSLLSQYLPLQYMRIRLGIFKRDPHEIIKDKIVEVLGDYHSATTR